MAVVGSAYVVINAITTGLGKQIETGLKKAAAGAGNASKSVDNLSGSLKRAFPNAEKASEAFASMNRKAYVMGTAIGVAASSIASLIGGIVALGGALASAAPAIVAVAGAFTGLILSGIAAKIALGGVGAAIQKFNQQQEKSAKDTKASKQAIEDAYRSLARVIQNNKEQLVAADKAVANAALEAEDAHLKFSEAVKAGREELQQIAFDAEDAALAEKKAAIELARAREILQRSQDLPSNSRARQEAELGYQEAELALRRAKDSNADLAQEQARLAKTGVDGLESVKNARIAAENADKAIEEAKISRSKTIRNGIIAQADAERAVARAKENAAKDDGGGDPFAKLTPSQKAFAKYLITLKPLMKGLRETVAKGFLPALQEGIERLVKDVFPTFKTGMGEIGVGLGKAVTAFTEAVADPQAVKNFGTVTKTAADTIGKFGKIFGNLWKAAMGIFAAADPLIRKFTDFLEKKSGAFANFIDTKGKSGELTTFFDEAGRIAGEIGAIIGNIASGLGNIIKANTGPGTGGQIMLDYFRDITAAFEAFSGSSSGQSKLKDYFAGAAENTKAILDTVGAFVKEFLKLGADPNTKIFWERVKEAAPIVGDLLVELNKSGPAAADLVVNMATFVKNLTESGAAIAFFETLNIVLEGLNKILENKIVKKLFEVSGKIHGVVFALGLVGIGITFMSNVFIGALLKIKGALDKIGGALKFLAKYILGPLAKALYFIIKLFGKVVIAVVKGLARMAVALLTNPIGLIVVVIALIVAGFIMLYKRSEIFREAVQNLGKKAKEVFDKIKEVIANVVAWVKENWPLILAVLTGPFGLIIYAVVKNFDAILAFFRGLPGKIKSAAAGIWNGLTDSFKAAINSIIERWNDFKLEVKVPPGFLQDKLGLTGRGFTLETPNIPLLAQGGTVMPSVGGTLVRVAEAGRPERIEPLDRQGLSRRDKALIRELSGGIGAGGAGPSIVVNPSPGMNEVEIAHLVSRRVAFNMRRGT